MYTSSGEQHFSVPTQAIRRFDDAANYCRDYFGQQGYINLASLLSGNGGDNDPVLGAAFCSNVGQKFQQTATTTQTYYYYGFQTESNGLPLRLEPTPFGECETVREMRVQQGGGLRACGADLVPLVIGLMTFFVFS